MRRILLFTGYVLLFALVRPAIAKDDWTPLMTAVVTSDRATLQAVLRQGGDANATNKWAQTALMQAAALRQIDSLNLLLAAGADLKRVDHDGRTAVDFALDFTGLMVIGGMKLTTEDGTITTIRSIPLNKNQFKLTADAQRDGRAVVLRLVYAGADLPSSTTGGGVTRQRALWLLGGVPARGIVVPALLSAIGDKDPSIRATVAQSLGSAAIEPSPSDKRSAEQVATLLAGIARGSQGGDASASAASSTDGIPESVAALVQALKDPATGVRLAAASALGMIGRPEGVPSLIAALKDKDANVRNLAAKALGRIGAAAREAIPALTALAADKGERSWVRQSAEEALQRIGR